MFSLGLFSNWWVWIGVVIAILLQILFTYTPLMNRLFHTAPFAPEAWIRIIIVGSLISVAVMIDKQIVRLIRKMRGNAANG